jgi:hypothetical protein
MPRCLDLAAQIASTSRASVAEAKRILTSSWGRGPEMANLMEQASFAALFGTEDQRRRMDAFQWACRVLERPGVRSRWAPGSLAATGHCDQPAADWPLPNVSDDLLTRGENPTDI